ncbi:MAG: RNA polymerase-binding protein DksA [Proteobacteria bacterium]|nr:RNA polymerase-binding protein DksA [Pseudomonadota bacterium]
MKFVDSTKITKKEKAYYQQKLEGMQNQLVEEFGETVQEMQDSNQEFPDPTDRANFESERNTTLRIRDRERKLIRKIRNALDRLENDEYNVCDECGDYIRKERLDARPVTTLCINCKEIEEQKEKIQQI